MFDSRNLRAAALAFGFGYLGAFPNATGPFTTLDGAHELGAYRYQLSPPVVPPERICVAFSSRGPSVTFTAVQDLVDFEARQPSVTFTPVLGSCG